MAVPVWQSTELTDRVPAGAAVDETVTVTKPPATVTGDLLLLVAASRTEGELSGITWPPLFDEILDGYHVNQSIFAAVKIAAGTEPASLDVTYVGITRSNILTCTRVTGADLAVPAYLSQENTGTSGVPTCPDINASVAESLVFRLLSYQRAASATPGAGTEIQRWNQISAGGTSLRHISAGATKEMIAPGQTGEYTWSGANQPWVTATVAIQPPTAAVGFKPQYAHPFTHSGL